MRIAAAVAVAALCLALLARHSATRRSWVGRYPTAEYRLQRAAGAPPLEALVGVVHPTKGDSPLVPVMNYTGDPVAAEGGVVTLRHFNYYADRNLEDVTILGLFTFKTWEPPVCTLVFRVSGGATARVSYNKIVDFSTRTGSTSTVSLPREVEPGYGGNYHRYGPPADYEFPVYTYTVE